MRKTLALALLLAGTAQADWVDDLCAFQQKQDAPVPCPYPPAQCNNAAFINDLTSKLCVLHDEVKSHRTSVASQSSLISALIAANAALTSRMTDAERALAALGGGVTPNPPPTCTAVIPSSGPIGGTLTLNGTNFSGVSAVRVNGTAAPYSVTSANQIHATVAAGTTSGTVTVVTTTGSADCGTYTVTPIITAVALADASVASGGTGNWSATLTVGANSTDDLVWTADDATTNEWPQAVGSTNANKPTCSLGASGCGTFTAATCSGTSCSVTYQAPNCPSGCSFMARATSRQSTSDPAVGGWLAITVTAPGGGGSALAISPPNLSIAPGGGQTFTASGGTGPYSWSLAENGSGATLSGGAGGATDPALVGSIVQTYAETAADTTTRTLTQDGSVTPLLCVAGVVGAASNAQGPVTVSSPNLTWTKQAWHAETGDYTEAALWTAPVSTNLAGEVVTFAWPGGAGGNSRFIAIGCWRDAAVGVVGVSPSAILTSGAVAATLTPTAAHSVIVAVGRANAGPAINVDATALANTTIGVHTRGSTYATDNWFGYLTATTSDTTPVTLGTSAPTITNGMIAVLELKLATSGLTGETIDYAAGAAGSTTDRVRVTDAVNATADAVVTVSTGGGGSVDPSVAFPGCMGSGCKTPGGRGGRVYKVTSLADTNTAGTLRYCINGGGMSPVGPRTCVFAVGGIIVPTSSLTVSQPYLTIAGQTAPGNGILLDGRNTSGDLFVVNTHDVVVRYMRFAQGPGASNSGSPIACRDGCINSVFDHVTSLWTRDENFTIWNNVNTNTHDITVSWTLLAEPMATHATNIITGANSQANANGQTNIDFHHNLFGTSSHRNPLAKHKSGRMVNNLTWNYSYYAFQAGGGGHFDIINNVFVAGPQTASSIHEIQSYPAGNSTTASGTQQLYVTGNIGPHDATAAANWANMVRSVSAENGTEGAVLDAGTYQTLTPLSAPTSGVAITASPTTGLAAAILLDVGASHRVDCNGAWVANRIAPETRIIGGYPNTGSTPAAPPDFPTTLPAGTLCSDAAPANGIPDDYERAKCGSPNCGGTNGAVVAPNGLTWLENWMAGL